MPTCTSTAWATRRSRCLRRHSRLGHMVVGERAKHKLARVGCFWLAFCGKVHCASTAGYWVADASRESHYGFVSRGEPRRVAERRHRRGWCARCAVIVHGCVAACRHAPNLFEWVALCNSNCFVATISQPAKQMHSLILIQTCAEGGRGVVVWSKGHILRCFRRAIFDVSCWPQPAHFLWPVTQHSAG